MEIVLGILCVLVLIAVILIIVFRPRAQHNTTSFSSEISLLQAYIKDESRNNRAENAALAKESRAELNSSLKELRIEISATLKAITEQNQKAIDLIHQTLDIKITGLIDKIDQSNKVNRESQASSLKDLVLDLRTRFDDLKSQQKEQSANAIQQLEKISSAMQADAIKMREGIGTVVKDFGETFHQNVNSFNNLQREKFAQLEERQSKLVDMTEKKLEEMRATVDEKLQRTLNERLGQSFELVGKQLESVQKGLGEMQTLAQDVGGLKRVLSNVKMRGGFGEVQLSLLLEQILAPEQYEANVKTKQSSTDLVEFAIKLPGKDDNNSVVWIPIDAKFPKDIYEQLQTAYDLAEPGAIELAQRNLEATIRKMAKSIGDKYLDPPNTTDFAIMFLPFEGIYAEVVRKASLLEDLQRQYKIIVTGPTTLAAILNSLQMGFRTLVIQKRSSEVWKILGAVKKEFDNFGGMLEKAQKNLQTASNQIDEVMGKRTRAIQRKLKGVEAVDDAEAQILLPEATNLEILDEEEDQ